MQLRKARHERERYPDDSDMSSEEEEEREEDEEEQDLEIVEGLEEEEEGEDPLLPPALRALERAFRPLNTGLTASEIGGSWPGSPTKINLVAKGWAQRRVISSRLLSSIEASSINTRASDSRDLAVWAVS
jgi:hypothetical protein